MARSLGKIASDYFNKASKFAGDVNEKVLNSDYNILAPKNLVYLANSPLVKNTPKIDVASKIQNPIARAAVSIPEAIVNTPMQSTQSAGHLIRSLNDRTATAQSLIGDTAGVAELPLLLASGGSAGAAGQTLKQKVITGALRGAKTGALYGGLHGLEAGSNDATVSDQVKRATKEAVVGLGAGALIGGATPLVTAGVSKVVQKIRQPSYDRSLYDLLDKDLSNIAQSDHPAKNEYIKATLDSLPEGKIKENLLKKYLSDERGFVDFSAPITNGTKQGSLQGKYLTKQAQDVIAYLAQGKSPEDILAEHPELNSGIQEASQRMRGFGLLADMDNAIKQKQWNDALKIGNAIKADKKYAEYIPQVDDYLSNVPKELGPISADAILEKVRKGTVTPEEGRQLLSLPEYKAALNKSLEKLPAKMKDRVNIAIDRGDIRGVLENYIAPNDPALREAMKAATQQADDIGVNFGKVLKDQRGFIDPTAPVDLAKTYD